MKAHDFATTESLAVVGLARALREEELAVNAINVGHGLATIEGRILEGVSAIRVRQAESDRARSILRRISRTWPPSPCRRPSSNNRRRTSCHLLAGLLFPCFPCL